MYLICSYTLKKLQKKMEEIHGCITYSDTYSSKQYYKLIEVESDEFLTTEDM